MKLKSNITAYSHEQYFNKNNGHVSSSTFFPSTFSRKIIKQVIFSGVPFQGEKERFYIYILLDSTRIGVPTPGTLGVNLPPPRPCFPCSSACVCSPEWRVIRCKHHLFVCVCLVCVVCPRSSLLHFLSFGRLFCCLPYNLPQRRRKANTRKINGIFTHFI